ncbi:MAG: hypothetical protein OHK0039_06710 [Bacteroidia bacterium]
MNLRRLRVLLYLLLLAPALYSQPSDSLQGFSPYLRVGTSVTYIWNNEVGPYDETTLNLNASLVVQPRWSIGVQFLHLWSRSQLLGSDQHHLWGGYVQYDLLSERFMRVYPELDLHLRRPRSIPPTGNLVPLDGRRDGCTPNRGPLP